MRLTRSLLGYFKRYVDHEIATTKGKTVYKNVYGWKRVQFDYKPWVYGEDRPWTDAAKHMNLTKNAKATKLRSTLVEPIKDWLIFRGDRVEILTGKDKGKQGIVTQIIKERNWCYVEGLNYKYEELYKTAKNPGSIIRREQPLLVTTEVSLVDPSDQKPTKVLWRYTEEGDQVRVSERTGRIIPLSRIARNEDPEDGVVKVDYKETAKDCTKDVVTKITFQPKLMTFEEDLMQQYGIKDDRKRAPTYRY
ncbi:probable 39S ribosomal protein L24, mitochondrial isoform X5 [Octopus sinensis]|uniref:Large ribosomal subunit protein uL24m n=1 Tax=Octopus sinensis TaxID=2607531 RepID=A0A6P7T8C5_9MOLL|nr:probable 39S ribosomal protein L24, mitochondrial isoform X5 [Octopus sinensis]